MLRAARLAEQFTYYNFSNEPDGNWQDFFLSEFNIIILMIPALDFAPRIRAYEKQVAEKDPVTVAQEIDINYSASVEGILIPGAWAMAVTRSIRPCT